MVDAAGSIEDRIFNFLLSRGVPPGEALSLAKEELARRAQDTMRNQEFAKQNPGSLSSDAGIDPSLPGSDPTAGQIPAANAPTFSSGKTPVPDRYAEMSDPEAKAAQAQDLARSVLAEKLRGGAPEVRQEQRRPSYQTMAGIAARQQSLNPQRESSANQMYDAARQKINEYLSLRAKNAVAAEPTASPTPEQPTSTPTSNAPATPSAQSGQPASASPAPNLGLPMADLPAALSGLSPPSAPAQRPSGGGGGGGSSASAPAARPEPAATAPAARPSPWTEYNKSMEDEGGGSAHLFARALEEERGRASGGAANSHAGKPASGRDAALHKALEIIQNLLMHRR